MKSTVAEYFKVLNSAFFIMIVGIEYSSEDWRADNISYSA